jgi:hypothetical protein
MSCTRTQALRSTTIVGVLVALGAALGGAASPASAADAQQIAVDAKASTLQSSRPNLGVEAKGYFDIGFDAERLFDVKR